MIYCLFKRYVNSFCCEIFHRLLSISALQAFVQVNRFLEGRLRTAIQFSTNGGSLLYNLYYCDRIFYDEHFCWFRNCHFSRTRWTRIQRLCFRQKPGNTSKL